VDIGKGNGFPFADILSQAEADALVNLATSKKHWPKETFNARPPFCKTRDCRPGVTHLPRRQLP
jgi:flagellar motor switch protein FliM